MKLLIEKVIVGGQGLARMPEGSGKHSGMRVFVPFTLPGEVIDAAFTEEHKDHCVGEARQIEHASEFRVDAPCPWFGVCGGCQLQHSSYIYQVDLKRAILAESLTRAGIRDLPQISVLTGEPFGYRNRIRLQVQAGSPFAIGYRKAKSHVLTAIEHCMISAPVLDQCIAALRRLGASGLIPAGTAELELFTNHDQSELLLAAWNAHSDSSQQPAYTALFEQLKEEIASLAGAVVLPTEHRKGNAPQRLLHWRKESLRYSVAGRKYTVSNGSFFQVNATLLDRFVEEVTRQPEDLERSVTAWDLYAGVGLFSLALAERFDRVRAVESSPSALKDLGENLRNTSTPFVNSTTLRFLEHAVEQITQRREPAPDLVVLDPPRAGAGVEACKLLARCNPRRIVYVSCDPATLGRDLTALIQSGYHLQELKLVDMFPQTHHLETIATLYR